jgi:predicted enzyme related to lactoylglutathione lyase
MIMQLYRAMIYVKDFPRMRQFYSEMLGSQPVNREWMDTWAEFEAGGARFALHAIPPEIAKDIQIASPPQPREKSPLKLVFQVPNVDAERAKLQARGIPMIQRPWGSWEGVDPEGNIFGLVDPEQIRSGN